MGQCWSANRAEFIGYGILATAWIIYMGLEWDLYTQKTDDDKNAKNSQITLAVLVTLMAVIFLGLMVGGCNIPPKNKGMFALMLVLGVTAGMYAFSAFWLKDVKGKTKAGVAAFHVWYGLALIILSAIVLVVVYAKGGGRLGNRPGTTGVMDAAADFIKKNPKALELLAAGFGSGRRGGGGGGCGCGGKTSPHPTSILYV
jgi:hypothetical protein